MDGKGSTSKEYSKEKKQEKSPLIEGFKQKFY
jgi:hypothetical protein